MDSSDCIDEVRSFGELNGVVNINVSDEMGSLFAVVTDAVDNEFVCSFVECVDVTTVEVKSTNSSVVVGPTVFIVVASVDSSKDEDRDEYSVELIRFSFVVDIELDTYSVDSE